MILRGAVLAAPAITVLRGNQAWALSGCGGQIKDVREINNNTQYEIKWRRGTPRDMYVGERRRWWQRVTTIDIDQGNQSSCLASYGVP